MTSALILAGFVGLANVVARLTPVLQVRTALRSLERLRVQPGGADAAAEISRVLESLQGMSRHGSEEGADDPRGKRAR